MSDNEIIGRLDLIIKLLAMNMVKDGSQKDRAIQLSKIGLQPKEIANILNTDPNTISVTLSKARKEGLL